MPKRIESPVKRFPGFVVLYDPLTFPQVIAYQDAVNAAMELGETTWMKLRYTLLPGIIPCVMEWGLEGVPEMPGVDTFPATPLQSAGQLVTWLQESITALLSEAETVPNE